MATNNDSSKIGEGCGTLIGYGVLLLVVWFVIAYLLPNGWRIKYAMQNFVSYENVTVEAQPTGCDFLRAPIGYKSCHYEKTVSTEEWRHSTTDTPIVSYDKGKTWEAAVPAPNVKIPNTYVYVGWNKIEDP